jgi:hypothetical protein
MRRQYIQDEIVTDLEMPGGIVQKHLYKIHLKMKGDREDNAWPTEYEKVGSDGHVLESVVFSNYRDHGLLHLPHDILISTFDDKGNLALRLEYSIRLIEINQPIDIGTFTISFDKAESVWDSDVRKFVKEKRAVSSRE